MPKQKPSRLQRKADAEPMVYRSAGLNAAEQIDAEKRSVPLVLATESPIDTYDFERMKVVKEVLRMDGIDMPAQIPLLDSHRQGSVLNVLGSIRDLKIDGDRLIGRAYFASHPAALRTFEAYQSGHLTDFSIGANRMAVAWKGDTKEVTRSRLIEGSAVVAGADPSAKSMGSAMRAYLDPHGLKDEAMFEQLKAMAIERGAPDNLDEAGYLAWLKENTVKRTAAPAAPPPAAPAPETPPAPAPLNRADVVRETMARINAIGDLCRQHGIEEVQRKAWVESDITPDAVAAEVLKRQTSTGGVPVTGPIRGGEAQAEKVYAAARDGLVMRCLHGQVNPVKALEAAKATGDIDAIARSTAIVDLVSKPAPGASDFRHASLTDIARRFIEESGVKTFGMTKDRIVRTALQRADGPGYHTTGSFSNLLLDATNKTLLAAYDEAATTYQTWVRTAPSTPDFKTINRIRFGELPDPEVVPENGEYKEKTPTDAKESYKVEKYGELFSITWEALVNDDLSALSRIPAMQGNAMRRKINKVCYAILTANAALADGVALFHASSHGANLDGAVLSVTTLNEGFRTMMVQTGLSGSGTILNIAPRFLIVPAALAALAYQIQGSIADPAAGGSAAGNSNTLNIYGPQGPRRVTVVVDAQLDGNSTTAWYLAADPSQIDTVELTFLQGEESPVLDREVGFEVDAVRYKIRQTFAAKAIDYRGLYQGNT